MPCRFSCTTLFSLSYVLNTRSKIGCVLVMMKYRPRTSTGMMARKISESLASMPNAATSEKIAISGLRTAMRMIIW